MILDLTQPVILEAPQNYCDKLYIHYNEIVKGDKVLPTQPVIFPLGIWDRQLKNGTRKKFLCGINLKYLDKEDYEEFISPLPKEEDPQQRAPCQIISSEKSLYDKYWKGRELARDIFKNAYREYDLRKITTWIKGRLPTLKISNYEKSLAKQMADKDGMDWEEMDSKDQAKYLDKAIDKSASDFLSSQEKGKEIQSRIKPDEPEIDLDDDEETEYSPVIRRLKGKKPIIRPEPGSIVPKDKESTTFIPIHPGIKAFGQGVAKIDPKKVKEAEPAPEKESDNPVDKGTKDID